MKRFFAVICALIFIFSLTATAFAAVTYDDTEADISFEIPEGWEKAEETEDFRCLIYSESDSMEMIGYDFIYTNDYEIEADDVKNGGIDFICKYLGVSADELERVVYNQFIYFKTKDSPSLLYGAYNGRLHFFGYSGGEGDEGYKTFEKLLSSVKHDTSYANYDELDLLVKRMWAARFVSDIQIFVIYASVQLYPLIFYRKKICIEPFSEKKAKTILIRYNIVVAIIFLLSAITRFTLMVAIILVLPANILGRYILTKKNDTKAVNTVAAQNCELLSSDEERIAYLNNLFDESMLDYNGYMKLCEARSLTPERERPAEILVGKASAHVAGVCCQSCGETVAKGTVICPFCGSRVK